MTPSRDHSSYRRGFQPPVLSSAPSWSLCPSLQSSSSRSGPPTALDVAREPPCPPTGGPPIVGSASPVWGPGFRRRGRTRMKVVRRVALAHGSLLAVPLGGGAHWKVP